VLENADLVLADPNDLTIAVLELGGLSNELLGHELAPSLLGPNGVPVLIGGRAIAA
jgi:hypothetical protein